MGYTSSKTGKTYQTKAAMEKAEANLAYMEQAKATPGQQKPTPAPAPTPAKTGTELSLQQQQDWKTLAGQYSGQFAKINPSAPDSADVQAYVFGKNLIKQNPNIPFNDILAQLKGYILPGTKLAQDYGQMTSTAQIYEDLPLQQQQAIISGKTPLVGTGMEGGTAIGEFGGKMVMNTGNPQTDKFLNEVWIPLMEAQLGNDPTTLFNMPAYEEIKAQVEATWGGVFTNELNAAKADYDLAMEKVGLEKGQVPKSTALEKEKIELERGRSLEDLATKKERLARNFQEAMGDSQAAMANRGLTFGGTRKKEERKLGEGYQEDVSDVEKMSKRTLEDLALQEKGLGQTESYQLGGYGLQEKGFGQEWAKKQKEIEGERTLQIQEEIKRLQGQGEQMLTSPLYQKFQ